MEKLVKKRLNYTIVSGLIYDADTQEMIGYATELPGKLSVERAQARARRVEHDNTIVVQSVEHVSRIMGISMDDFLEMAVEVD